MTSKSKKVIVPSGNEIEKLVEATPSNMIKRVRLIACPPGSRGSWLRLLNDKQLMECFHRLRAGETVQSVVRRAQQEWSIEPQSKTGSLARSMRKFRKHSLGDIFDRDAKDKDDHKEMIDLSKQGKLIAEQIDVLDYLGWTIKVQADRIRILHEKEKSSIPFRFTDKSMQVMGQLLESYSRIQQDLGLVNSNRPPTLNLNVSAKFKDLISNNVDDEEKITAALHEMAEQIDEHMVTLSVSDDGSYEFKEGGKEKSNGDTTCALPESTGDSGQDLKKTGTVNKG